METLIEDKKEISDQVVALIKKGDTQNSPFTKSLIRMHKGKFTYFLNQDNYISQSLVLKIAHLNKITANKSAKTGMRR